MANLETFDAVVIGGGPSGATAATDLAKLGRTVLLLDRAGRIKPCGGAIPPQAMRDFDIPESMLANQVNSARMVSPTDRTVDMPINGGYVGMVDREHFDEWLRERAATAGAVRRVGTFERIERDSDGTALVCYRPGQGRSDNPSEQVRARAVIGADGAHSSVAKQCIPGSEGMKFVSAYHEIVRTPPNGGVADFDGTRCDVYYQGDISPDFYGWVFPHGDTTSVGVGTAVEGFSLRSACTELRRRAGLAEAETLRREGAPIPLEPLPCWDNGRDIVLAGDASGVVAPASGEGIYYALVGGRLAAEAVAEFLTTGKASALKNARKRFMKAHGKVFWVLGILQRFWYASDKRRERFVSLCADPDIQYLTWEAYMNKRLVKARPGAHLRIFFKDMAHLLGIVSPVSSQPSKNAARNG
ncbi:geranylgeranyl diphosphate reductase [Thiocystis violascens]|uniref:Protein CbrA n=1 Tax=Thiocystis violascens (strain ATCC 17096 / DSM 198 / 6111) TaxID=765911 RepID=I3YBJ1_THIV6|nr:geranylgeranyl diphosphate reductase [Thiocystis violascens]AFL74359.1 geranylgeranyl reductase family protein [Thiocystis violascens DSM 198]